MQKPTVREAFAFLYFDLYPPVLDLHVVAFDRAFLFGKAFAGADVETPAVPIALDDVAVEARISKRVALVWTEILGGMEGAADVKEGDLGSVL